MKICPNCGKENFDKSFCTKCGHDISNVETEEKRKIREEKEMQEELERIEREQAEKQAEIERIEREQVEKQAEIERIEREQKRKQAEIERKERLEKERQKRKRKSRLKIIGVLIIIILLLSVFLYFQINTGNNNQISDLNNDNQNTVDESITSQNNVGHYKKVDFNGLFTMDVPEDSGFEESTPQLNATYQWDSWGFNVRYYNQYDDINQLVSMYLNENPTLNYSTEGNLFILDNYGFTDYPVDTQGFVGVQSQDNKIVVINGREDLNTLKTLANSIIFE